MIHKVTKEFREAETKVKVKDCQGIRVRSYQYQKGNAIFIHSNGDVKKVAACKIKSYELKERTEEKKEENRDEERCPEIIEEENKVENDDKKEESEIEVEESEDENEVIRDLRNNVIGAKYLQVEKSVYFMDYEIFTLEVPVREHG